MSICHPNTGKRNPSSGTRHRSMLVYMLVVGMLLLPVGGARGQRQARFANTTERSAFVAERRRNSRQEKVEAEAWARARGRRVRFEVGPTLFELMAIRDGRPVYNMTHNVNAAISTAADLVRNTSPYNVDGAGLTAGVWDGGAVLVTHQEFGGRVAVMDGAASHYHATHVGGTIGAAGVVAAALGMTPAVEIDSYDWNSDESEMATRAASYPAEANKLPVSNHSYGHVSGWTWTDDSGSTGYHWPANNPWGADAEEENFGQYDSTARANDQVVYDAPYFLPFKSAGNDRNDNPGSETIYYSTDGGTTWNSATYNSSLHPAGDGVYRSGYDTIPHVGMAKNLMTVGAVADAVSGASRSLGAATMSSFSGWGPADDGRIKPDIVANGVALYSCDNVNNSAYATRSGTSMSTPNACGSALLLVEVFADLFPGQALRASSLKGLIIHTADDLGTTGPDYSFGWGLMNTEAAANHLRDYSLSPGNRKLVEGCLSAANTSDTYSVTWNGVDPLRVTLCWTDPPGVASSTHDDRSGKLVNDLDLRMMGPGGSSTYWPYRLDVANPSAAAGTGENDIDNVEQVYLAGPAAGMYTLVVDYDGSLTDNQQWYSLLISGGQQSVSAAAPSLTSVAPTNGGGQGWVTVSGTGFQLGANVTLQRAGYPDIEGTGEQGAPEQILVLFDLTAAAPGVWDVKVTNPDGNASTLESAFLVEDIVYAESFESGLGVWQQSSADDFDWSWNSGGTPSDSTGPDGAYDGNTYVYTEASSPNSPNKSAELESDHDFSSVAAPFLRFRYHMFGATTGSLYLDVYDGAWTSGVWSRSGEQHSSEADAWTEAMVDLSGYGGQSAITLRFRGVTGTSYTSDMALDDVQILETGQAGTNELVIVSAYAMADPPVGTNRYTSGSLISCSVTNASLTVSSATRQSQVVCTGWVGTGSAPASGNTTQTEPFALGSDSSVTWRWAVSNLWLSNQTVNAVVTEEALDRVTAGGNYRVGASGDVTFRSGRTVWLKSGFTAGTGSQFRATIEP